MKELNQIINDKMAELLTNGVIEKAIEEKLENALQEAIRDQFSYSGAIKKSIETAMKEGLGIDLSNIDFDSYNQQMLTAVKVKVGNMFAGGAVAKFNEDMDELFKVAPKEVSINELVNIVVKHWQKDDYRDNDSFDEYATVELEESSYGSYSLSIWKKLESSSTSIYSSGKNRADVVLFINQEGELRINHRHSYNPTCFDEVETFIFKLYSAGTKITGLDEFDADDCELQILDEDENY